MKVSAQRNVCRNGVDILFTVEQGGRPCAVQPVVMEVRTFEPGVCMEPSLTLSFDTAQALMQQLWDEGFRPNNGAGSSAEAEALRGHIKFAERVADRLMLATIPVS